jgi:chromosomal replication initiator protein
MFNPKYTFESFIDCEDNTFARAAVQAGAKFTAKGSCNPILIYGEPGRGKTHLLHAIGQHALKNNKDFRVVYLSAEKFANEFADAIGTSQHDRFRDAYIQNDVLLIDDIQFLIGKEHVQEELFHIFSALHETQKLMVMTSNRPISEIQGFEQRLTSHFEWILVTDLQPSDTTIQEVIFESH